MKCIDTSLYKYVNNLFRIIPRNMFGKERIENIKHSEPMEKEDKIEEARGIKIHLQYFA